MGSPGPGEESPQQTGTKGAGGEVGRGNPGRGDAPGGAAGTAAGAGRARSPSPAAARATAAPPRCARGSGPTRRPPRRLPGRPPRLPCFRAAALALAARVPAAGRIASRPLSIFIKLPRPSGGGTGAAERRGGAGRVNRATVEALSGTCEVRAAGARRGGRSAPGRPTGQHTPCLRGWAEGVGGGARGQLLPTPRVVLARRLKLYKECGCSRPRAGDIRTARGGGQGAGASNFGAAAAAVADVAL